MNVQVAYGLTCYRAVVDADVVSGRMKLRIQLSLGLVEQCEQGRSLVATQLEETANMAQGDDQCVSR